MDTLALESWLVIAALVLPRFFVWSAFAIIQVDFRVSFRAIERSPVFAPNPFGKSNMTFLLF